MTTYALNLGTSKTGLTDLRAQLVTTLGVNSGSAITTGFTEVGSGQYLFDVTIDPTFNGAIKFYRAATPTDIYGTLAINATSGGTVPASGNAATVNAYTYTRDSQGVIAAGVVVNYQQLAQSTVGTWSDAVSTVTSDSNGLAQIEMTIGGTYKYWVHGGRQRTVVITNATSDPYALPVITG